MNTSQSMFALLSSICNVQFNARSESIREKASFRRLVPKRRCLVAVEGYVFGEPQTFIFMWMCVCVHHLSLLLHKHPHNLSSMVGSMSGKRMDQKSSRIISILRMGSHLFLLLYMIVGKILKVCLFYD